MWSTIKLHLVSENVLIIIRQIYHILSPFWAIILGVFLNWHSHILALEIEMNVGALHRGANIVHNVTRLLLVEWSKPLTLFNVYCIKSQPLTLDIS